VLFNLFSSKPQPPVEYDLKISEVFNEVFSYFQENHPKEVEKAKEDFVRLTGQFDEEHEYFESKLDDFRVWYVFFYGGNLFENLAKIKESEELSKYYPFLRSGTFSNFIVQKVRNDEIHLQDLADGVSYIVKDPVSSLSMEKGGCVQTSVYYAGEGFYEFGVSLVVHPYESTRYIKKKTREAHKGKGISKEELFERLMGMRYQFFKYRQLEVKQIYSDKSLLFEKISDKKI
jgi:hypothetical protein